MSNIGIVVIGRNEGDRLIRCLKSIIQQLTNNLAIVYVDSGSTDESVASAQALRVHTIELDLSIPFTMARGRNVGFNYLVNNFPAIQYVQFIDGDCELVEGWIESALARLESDSDIAVVCGRRRERFPDASLYNRLADIEWNTPIGEVTACGGDILARAKAIREVEGYNQLLICGEEPEMCIRLRQKGWKIWRIDAEMTLHDAAMLRFRQFWIRSIRGGWAVAQGVAMYGDSPDQYKAREHFSGLLWGFILPATAIGATWITSGLSLVLFLAYPILTWKMYKWCRSRVNHSSDAVLYSLLTVISKPAQAFGQFKYWITRHCGGTINLIEYKNVQMK